MAVARLKKVGDAAGVASTIATLDKKMPLLLGFLENEDDDVSQTVTEFAHTYITMLRASLPLSPQHALNIKACTLHNDICRKLFFLLWITDRRLLCQCYLKGVMSVCFFYIEPEPQDQEP